MKKRIITTFQNIDPSASKTIAAGYALGQEWYNTATGEKFYHKIDGVWVSVESTGSGATLGLIRIVDKLGEKFTDLATAGAYVRTFTNAAITDESFSSINETYWFSVPNGSSFALANNFLNNSNAYIVDELGIIAEFGDSAFLSNTGNNILGDCSFGVNAFRVSTGNNTLGDCTFTSYAFNQSIGNNILGDCIFTSKALEASSGDNILGNCTFTTDAFRLATGNNILGDCTFGNTAFYSVSGNNEMGLCSFGTDAFVSSSGGNILGNCTFVDNAFQGATGNNILGNCTFGDYPFYGTTGINKFRNILLSTSTFNFASNSLGRFEIYGNIGTDETANYANFFTSSTAVIWALKAKETSNAGGIEGDLLTAQANGAKLFFGYANAGSSAALGLIKIVDKAGVHFTDLATAGAYIRTFTNATITDESFSNGTYWFTVPNGTDFNLTSGFLTAFSASAYIVDELGLIDTFGASAFFGNIGNNILGNCTFGNDAFRVSTGNNILGDCTFIDRAFRESTGNNILGNCTFADSAFNSATGDNKLGDCVFGMEAFRESTGNNILGNCTFGYGGFLNAGGNDILGNCTFGSDCFYGATGIYRFGNILLSTSTFNFARSSTGRFEIYGNIGTDETANYLNFFSNNVYTTSVIWAQKAKETSNAGGIEGDLATAQTNGATLFFGYETLDSIIVASNDIVTGSAPKINFINGTDANASSTYDNLNNKIDIRIDASINVTNATKITLMYNT